MSIPGDLFCRDTKYNVDVFPSSGLCRKYLGPLVICVVPRVCYWSCVSCCIRFPLHFEQSSSSAVILPGECGVWCFCVRFFSVGARVPCDLFVSLHFTVAIAFV